MRNLRRLTGGFIWLQSINAMVTIGTCCDRGLVEKRPDAFGGTGVFAATDSIEPSDILFTLAADDIPVGTIEDSQLAEEVLWPLVSSNDAVTAIYSLSTALAAWKLLDDSSVSFLSPVTKRKLESGLSPALSKAAADLPWSTIRWQIPLCWSTETLNKSLICAAEGVVTHDEGAESTALAALLEGKRRTRILRRYASRLSDALCTAMAIDTNEFPVHCVCRQAVALVASRMFTLKDMRAIALLPMIDCINHSSSSPNARLVDTGDIISVVATTAIPQNAQVYISYGCPAAEDAFATYGFIPTGSMSTCSDQALALALEVGQTDTKAELHL